MATLLDSAVPPTAEQIAAAKALYPDLRGWMGYVPNWGNPYKAPGSAGWQPADVQRVLEAGLGFFPLLVPENGNPASTPPGEVGWVQAVGFARNLVEAAGGQFAGCGLDVEASWANQYGAAWRDRVVLLKAGAAADSSKAAVYGPPSWLQTLASLGGSAPDAVIAAEWPDGAAAPSPVPSSPMPIPNLPSDLWDTPGQRAWQYQGGHELGTTGLQVDCSVIDDAFPLSFLPPPAPAPAPEPTPAPEPAPEPSSGPQVLTPGQWQIPAGTYTLPAGVKITIPALTITIP
jgi:hypothetical protein